MMKTMALVENTMQNVKIETRVELLKAIAESDEILIRVKFGNSDYWMQISKEQAQGFADTLYSTETPADFNMNRFGTFMPDKKCLVLG